MVLVIARARGVPGPHRSRRRSRGGWRCSSSASSRAWPRSWCTTGSSKRLASHPCRGKVLFALAVAAIAPLLIAEIARMVRERSFAVSAHGRMADVALVSSAMLMAVSADGVQGIGGLGLWGPVVFTIPLLAAWYSYERLALDPAHLRPDHPCTRRRPRARRHGARRARRASRRGRRRHGWHARVLAVRARAARDGRAAAPPRPGVHRRTGRRPPARARLHRALRRHDPAEHCSSSRPPATSSPRSGCRIGSRSGRARR